MFGSLLRCAVCNGYNPDLCTCNADPALKGVKDGNCNRTACQRPGASWYNRVTQAWYCPHCARLINSHCGKDEEPLCAKPDSAL